MRTGKRAQQTKYTMGYFNKVQWHLKKKKKQPLFKKFTLKDKVPHILSKLSALKYSEFQSKKEKLEGPVYL